MQVEGVDPRDVTWEINQPTYRVYFWGRGESPSPKIPGHVRGLYCRERRVLDAFDIHQVIAWANDEAEPNETYMLYIERTESGETGLVRLAGTDPSAG
jgi:hypothetical protein